MLKVVTPGFYTTIQDLGRWQWRHKGVPVSGTMDDIARHHVNTLLENPVSAAVLEITMTGPKVVFETENFFCLTGADLSPTLNDAPIQNYQVYKVKVGDVLSFGRLRQGFRSYLGIKGGFQAPMVLESVSQYFPITPQKKIIEGEEIHYNPIKEFEPKISQIKTEDYLEEKEIAVTYGPEIAILTAEQKQMIFEMEFTVSKENNRMAYQLQEKIGEHAYSMLTSAVLPGTVQMTPAGQLIVLMKDGQTTGGYPRILQLSDKAIAILAQKKSGDTIRFKKS
ncbi:MAG: biotin-dependent carboxyltransferase family protein [Bacteroidota bacterium]